MACANDPAPRSTLRAVEMIREYLRDTASQLLRGRNMQEFVGAVGVGVWTKHSANQKLRFRKTLAEHPHKWNRSAFSHVRRRFSEIVTRRLVKTSLEPRRESGRIPTARTPIRREANLASIGRIFFQNSFQFL